MLKLMTNEWPPNRADLARLVPFEFSAATADTPMTIDIK